MSAVENSEILRGTRPVELRGTRRSILMALLFLGALTLLSLRLEMKINVPGHVDEAMWGLQDFRDAIYYPVVAFLDGNNPYDTVAYTKTYPVRSTFRLYSPLTLLVHLPFGLLSPGTAQLAYFALTAVLLFVIAQLALVLCGIPSTVARLFGISTLLLLSRPGYQDLLVGQYTVQMVIGTYVALLFARKQPWVAALGLALTTTKPTYGLPLAVLLFARGDTTAVVRGLGIAAVPTAVMGMIVAHAAGGISGFLSTIPQNHAAFLADGASDAALSLFRVDAVAVVGHLLQRRPAVGEEVLISLTVLGLAIAGLRRLVAIRSEPSQRLSDTLVCLGVLLCTYHQPYDVLLVAFPLLAVATGALWTPAGPPGRAIRWALLAALTFPAVNYLTTGAVDEVLGLHGFWWIAYASLNGLALSCAFFLVLMLSLLAAQAIAGARVSSSLSQEPG